MLLQLDVHLLIGRHIQYVRWRSAGLDLCEDGGVLGIVKAVERAVVDGEAVGPEVEAPFDGWSSLGSGCVGVFDDLAGCVVAAESACCACEARARGLWIVSAGSFDVSRDKTLSFGLELIGEVSPTSLPSR